MECGLEQFLPSRGLASVPPKTAGPRFKEKIWPHPKKWMLSGELTNSGSRLANPRARTTNSITKRRKSCKRLWIKKTNPDQRDAVA